MTCEEFSNEFDVLINSYSNQLQFGSISSPLEFDEYEKSVFLTQAQEKIVVGIYNGNLTGYSLDELEEYSDRNHVPETSLSFSSSYTQEEWENMKSTVKVQKKNKDGIIIEDYSYDYFPNKKKKKGKTK